MKHDESRGTFADVVGDNPPGIAAIAHYLREQMAGLGPDIVEVPRPAENHAGYAVGQGRPDEVFGYICPMRDYVRLGFYYGAALPDPHGLLAGEGKRLRHVKLRTLAEAERPAVRRLLEAALAERLARR